MRKVLLMLFGWLPMTAHSEVVTESLCFELSATSPVKFELRTYSDISSRWSGGFVKYATSDVPIPLVLKDSQSEELNPQGPFQNTDTWTEVSNGKVSGEYEMVSQGGVIVSMTYTKQSNGKQYSFSNNTDTGDSLESGCQWK